MTTQDLAHLAGRVEHPDLPSDAAAGQHVYLLVPQLQCGPGQRVEIFFDILVLVLHEDGAAVHIDDADGIAATSRNQARCLSRVNRVRLEYNLQKKKDEDPLNKKDSQHTKPKASQYMKLTSQIWV